MPYQRNTLSDLRWNSITNEYDRVFDQNDYYIINIKNTTYQGNEIINSIDLNYKPWVNNSICKAFDSCTNLTSITNINQNITNGHLAFYNCINLTNIPTIPNSISDMDNMFENCINLTNIPTIPNSVTTLSYTFQNCTNIMWNIYIASENIESVEMCFMDTSLTKNVYIPFNYTNNTHTITYNSFIREGYDEIGTQHGVYLKDINQI